jgi:hypothetical protein
VSTKSVLAAKTGFLSQLWNSFSDVRVNPQSDGTPDRFSTYARVLQGKEVVDTEEEQSEDEEVVARTPESPKSGSERKQSSKKAKQ